MLNINYFIDEENFKDNPLDFSGDSDYSGDSSLEGFINNNILIKLG